MNWKTEYNINLKSTRIIPTYQELQLVKDYLAWPNRLLMDREYRLACRTNQKWRYF